MHYAVYKILTIYDLSEGCKFRSPLAGRVDDVINGMRKGTTPKTAVNVPAGSTNLSASAKQKMAFVASYYMSIFFCNSLKRVT